MKQFYVMSLYMLSALGLLLVPVHAGDGVDCANDNMTQMEMNFCAHSDFMAADKDLNELWPKVTNWARALDADIKDYQPEDARTFDNLLKAQRAWIDFRDGHCTAEGLKFAGGSIQPLIISACMEGLTKARTAQLLQLIQEG